MVNSFAIAGRRIGPGHPCFVIAEAGVNHNGDVEMARQLVRVAAASGADAVKFQTFNASELATEAAPKAEYQKGAGEAGETQVEMLRRLELSHTAHREIMAECHAAGIVFLSSPFDPSSAEFLRSLGVPALKVPSGEITNLPFLHTLAGMNTPLILSTGMSDLAEVEQAVAVIRGGGNPPLAILHCVSNYPAPAASCNLRAMKTLADRFMVPVGFSDHTVGNEAGLAAVALGANVLERHFTLDRSLPGPDHQASLDPRELSEFVRGIRTVESALGTGEKRPVDSERGTAAVARKSLVAAADIRAGSRFAPDLIVARRPGTGIPPSAVGRLIGRVAKASYKAGDLLGREELE